MSSPPQTPTPLYETLTLSPLSPSISHAPIQSSPSEPYTVFRSQISLSTSNCEISDDAAPDYFSLEMGEDEPKTPSEVGEPKRRVEPDSEPLGLESSWFRGNSRFKSPMLQLHQEIVDFCEFLSPTPEEQTSRNTAVETVSNVIRDIWPACKVEVFGSFRTGLYLPSSDIDVVILESGTDPQVCLQALSRALSREGIAKKMQVIAKARVPIIKFVEKRSGVSFDISFDVDNGPKAADIIKDAVSKWPPLRPLCLILKVFLQQRELNEVYSGGIGSYALLTMLMAMLQNLSNNRTFPEHNLGVLLVHFFDFYGCKLNTADVGVSCRGATTFFSKRSRGFLNKGRPFLISIEDPQAPDNDIGKNSFNYSQIRSAFKMAFSKLTDSKILLGLGPNKSILGTIIRPDPVLVERKGGQNGDVTFNSLLPGAEEPLQSQWDHHQDLLGNWQFNNEEETLPRGNGIFGETSAESSGKKRRSVFKDKSSKKKLKNNGEVGNVRHEKNSSRKDKETKKQRWRTNHNNVNGFSRSNGGSPWTR